LNETSVRQVNLPSDVKEKFLAKYNNNNELGSDLFVECKDSAMRLLAMDSLPRFFKCFEEKRYKLGDGSLNEIVVSRVDNEEFETNNINFPSGRSLSFGKAKKSKTSRRESKINHLDLNYQSGVKKVKKMDKKKEAFIY